MNLSTSHLMATARQGADVVHVQLLIFCRKPHCLAGLCSAPTAAYLIMRTHASCLLLCLALLARCPCSASTAAHLLMRVHVGLANGVNDTVATPEGVAGQLTDVLGKGGTEQNCLAGLL